MTVRLDFPIPSVTIIPWSDESLGGALGTTAPASGGWSATNRAVVVPFRVYHPIKVYSMFLINGATGTFDLDLGVYDPAGRLLASTGGSTPQSGNNNFQEVSFSSALSLGGGLYYMALSLSSSSATVFRRTLSNVIMNAFGCYIIASALPLPASATFATVPASTNLPLFGVRTYA